MHNRTLHALSLVLCVAGCAPGPNQDHDYVFVSELAPMGERAPLSGCNHIDGDSSFAVGSWVHITAREDTHCIDRAFDGYCRAHAPPATSFVVSSSDPSVLAIPGADSTGRARIDAGSGLDARVLAPGEATLFLELDGADVASTTLRAEVPAMLEPILVARPAIEASSDGSVDADLRSATGVALLRGGSGARFFVRPIGRDGSVLCGHAAIEAVSADGLQVALDSEYSVDPPGLHDVMVISARQDAPSHAHIELESAGLRTAIEADVIDPSALTELRASEQAVTIDYDPFTMVELTLLAGEREVHGAGFTAEVQNPCGSTLLGPGQAVEHGSLSPRDTRLLARSTCTDPVPYRVSVVGAPEIGVDLVAPTL